MAGPLTLRRRLRGRGAWRPSVFVILDPRRRERQAASAIIHEQAPVCRLRAVLEGPGGDPEPPGRLGELQDLVVIRRGDDRGHGHAGGDPELESAQLGHDAGDDIEGERIDTIRFGDDVDKTRDRR